MQSIKATLCKSESGAVMLEFIAVLPLYLFMLGLLFIYGEVMLFNNRVLQSNRIAAYSDLSGLVDKLGQFILEEKNGVSLFKMDNLKVKPDYPPGEDEYVQKTDFAMLKGSYSYAENVVLPGGIQGLLLLPAILENPETAQTEYPAFSLGKQALDKEYWMHWSVVRKREPDWYMHGNDEVRKQMGQVTSSKETCDDMEYYLDAVNYQANASSAVKPYKVIMAKRSGDDGGSEGNGGESNPESRQFATFFSGQR